MKEIDSRKKIIWANLNKLVISIGSIICSCIIAVFLLQIVINHLTSNLYEQTAALRWKKDMRYEQISCFFSEGNMPEENRIKGIHIELENMLVENGIIRESETNMWIDAYSGQDNLFIEGSYACITAMSIGAGGDFFLFHSLPLKDGEYFTQEMSEENVILLHENSAWALFGSVNVVGLDVTIQYETYKVVGVVSNDNRYLSSEAGAEEYIVYIPYSKWDDLVEYPAINCYQLLFPNPINQFAKSCVEKVMTYYEEKEIVENSNRFSMVNTYKKMLKFPEQYMDKNKHTVPYWENMARGYEGIKQLVSLCQISIGFGGIVVSSILMIKYHCHLKRNNRG